MRQNDKWGGIPREEMRWRLRLLRSRIFTAKKFRLEAQHRSECWLAAACALANREYRSVTGAFQSAFGRPWSRCFDTNGRWLIRYTLHCLGMPGLRSIVPSATAAPDLYGRGHLIVKYAGSEFAHSLAYVNGEVFDSNYPAWGWLTWEEYRSNRIAACGDVEVIRIQRLEVGHGSA